MIWEVPWQLEAAVMAAARQVLGDAPLATPALTRAIIDRSLRYTSERDRLSTAPDHIADLAARAAFFTIADAMKIAIPLGELSRRGALADRSPLSVLDLGAGCGAQSLGLASCLDRPLAMTAIDRDRDALAIAERALARYPHVAFSSRAGDVTQVVLPSADLVVIGGVINELTPEAGLSVVERALAAIPPDGAVIIIEPALRTTARALHELRDAVLGRGLAHVFAPCTRRVAPCPALAQAEDWCHEDRGIRLPPATAELARLTHLRDGGMKFSYLVLRREPSPLVDGDGSWRVVSAPRSLKGKFEVFGCSDAGRVPIRLLRKNRTPGNREIERAVRGDVVLVQSAASAEPRLEIDREAAVQRIDLSLSPHSLNGSAATRKHPDER